MSEGVNLVISSWHGVFVPRGTPPEMTKAISAAVGKVCADRVSRECARFFSASNIWDHPPSKNFFAEQDQLNLALIRKLGLYVERAPK